MRIISGKYKRIKLCPPEDFSTRPSTDRFRETVMGILEGGKFGYPLKTKIIIDVFAGTGALGIEAASRGNPSKVIFIESDKIANNIIRSNIEILNTKNIFYTINEDVRNINEWKFEPSGLVFLDPPYFSNLGIAALSKLNELHALSPGAIIIYETSVKEFSPKIDSCELLLSKKVSNSLINIFKYSPSFK